MSVLKFLLVIICLLFIFNIHSYADLGKRSTQAIRVSKAPRIENGLMGSNPDIFINMKKIRSYLLLKYPLKPDLGRVKRPLSKSGHEQFDPLLELIFRG